MRRYAENSALVAENPAVLTDQRSASRCHMRPALEQLNFVDLSLVSDYEALRVSGAVVSAITGL
jgi:hypothetical protein